VSQSGVQRLRLVIEDLGDRAGGKVAALWPECLTLLGLGVAILWFASTRFRKRIG